MKTVISEYLEFVTQVVEGKKTLLTKVYSRRNGALLAEIKWYGPWRQYCFFPNPHTIWNPACLKEVNDVIETLMKRHREVREILKTASN